jgi:hypothetical protein
MDNAPKFKRLRTAERQYHSRSSGTIIQDPDRARVQTNNPCAERLFG